MKASELRIGNLVYNEYSSTKMEIITAATIMFIDQCNNSCKKTAHEPFVIDGCLHLFKDVECDTHALNGFTIKEMPFKYVKELRGWVNCNAKIIKYVHELQNYIFAMTGEELKFKK